MLLEICSKFARNVKYCPECEKVLKGAQNAKQCSKLKKVLKWCSAQSEKAYPPCEHVAINLHTLFRISRASEIYPRAIRGFYI